MQPFIVVFLTIVGLSFGASLNKDDPSRPRTMPAAFLVLERGHSIFNQLLTFAVARLNIPGFTYLGKINGKWFYHDTVFRNHGDAKILCENSNLEFGKVETQEELDFIADRTKYHSYPWIGGVYSPVAQHSNGSLVNPQLEIKGYTENLTPRALLIQNQVSPATIYVQVTEIETGYICMKRIMV